MLLVGVWCRLTIAVVGRGVLGALGVTAVSTTHLIIIVRGDGILGIRHFIVHTTIVHLTTIDHQLTTAQLLDITLCVDLRVRFRHHRGVEDLRYIREEVQQLRDRAL